VRAEDRVLHAAVKQPDALPPRATRRDHLGEGTAPPCRGQRGEQGLGCREARREEPQEAARPDEPLQPAPLVGAKRSGHQAEQARARQQAVERGAPH
jgi:hypothetical protein